MYRSLSVPGHDKGVAHLHCIISSLHGSGAGCAMVSREEFEVLKLDVERYIKLLDDMQIKILGIRPDD